MTLNLKNEMEKQLSKNVLLALQLCSLAAEHTGTKVYLIGGVVRDLFLKKEIFDIDITVQGDATKFCHFLANKGTCKILQVQNDLKTVKVMFKNKVEIDFASTREETYPQRGHLPEIVRLGCPLKEDVCRRDFTINSLAISLNEKDFGEVIDYVGGIDDLQKGILRVLHDNSFNEDPSRIIRGLKFAARFKLQRDAHTKMLQEQYINSQIHRDISWTRIKSELKQTFSLNDGHVFDMFMANDTYKLIFGEKVEFTGLEIKTLVDKYNPEYIWLTYLGCVLDDEQVIESLCLTRAEKRIFSDKKKLLSEKLSMLNSNYEIYKFFEKKSLESVIIYYLLTQRKEALVYLEKLSNIKVEINGDEIKALGVKDGKQIGKLLDKVLKRKLAGQIINKTDEINYVKTKIN